MPEKGRCGDCACWDQLEGKYAGTCYRYPPEQGMRCVPWSKAIWPVTHSDDGCWSFIPTPEPFFVPVEGDPEAATNLGDVFKFGPEEPT